MIGRITFFNCQRNFGFITVSSGEQYFFHIANCVKGYRPRLSEKVTFSLGEPISEGKKEQAIHVSPATQAQIDAGASALAGGTN
jgi:cold shock CspA family protein